MCGTLQNGMDAQLAHISSSNQKGDLLALMLSMRISILILMMYSRKALQVKKFKKVINLVEKGSLTNPSNFPFCSGM